MATHQVDAFVTLSTLFARHGEFYRTLDEGLVAPTTDQQRRFVEVCRGRLEPSNDHELSWRCFKGGETGIAPKRSAPGDVKDESLSTQGASTPDQSVVQPGLSSTVDASSPTAFDLIQALVRSAGTQEEREKLAAVLVEVGDVLQFSDEAWREEQLTGLLELRFPDARTELRSDGPAEHPASASPLDVSDEQSRGDSFAEPDEIQELIDDELKQKREWAAANAARAYISSTF